MDPRKTDAGQTSRNERKALASRYHQLLSGHAATGAYLCNRIGAIPSDKCRCRRDEKQARYRLFAKCEAWSKALRQGPRVESRTKTLFEGEKAT